LIYKKKKKHLCKNKDKIIPGKGEGGKRRNGEI